MVNASKPRRDGASVNDGSNRLFMVISVTTTV